MPGKPIEQDLQHLRDFPEQEKARILHRITHQPALSAKSYYGENCYENIATMLRAKGFELIDIEREENAFTTMWYRRNSYWFGLITTEFVAIVEWESVGNGEQATLRRWRL